MTASESLENEDHIRCPNIITVVGGCEKLDTDPLTAFCSDCKDFNECEESWRCDGHVQDVGIDYPMMFCDTCHAKVEPYEIDHNDAKWNNWEYEDMSSKEDKS